MANELALDFQPYTSPWCDVTPYYERYGNVIVHPGEEVYLYVFMPCVQPFRYAISNKMVMYDYIRQEFMHVRTDPTSGYKTVQIFDMNQQKTVTHLIHRIYMLTFCYYPGCEDMDVNHIDGNRSNCVPWNLEWLTHADNMRHANEHLMNFKITDSDIVDIIRAYNNGEEVRQIARNYGVSSGYIADIVRSRPNKESERIKHIKDLVPVIRPKFSKKGNIIYLDETSAEERKALEILTRYNNGESFVALGKAYNVSNVTIKNIIMHYVDTHPGTYMRRPETSSIFTDEQVHAICSIFAQYGSQLAATNLYTYCIRTLGLEDSPNLRSILSGIYNRRTYTSISSAYNF